MDGVELGEDHSWGGDAWMEASLPPSLRPRGLSVALSGGGEVDRQEERGTSS